MSRKIIIPKGVVDDHTKNSIIEIPTSLRQTKGNLIAKRQGNKIVAQQLPDWQDDLSTNNQPGPSHLVATPPAGYAQQQAGHISCNINETDSRNTTFYTAQDESRSNYITIPDDSSTCYISTCSQLQDSQNLNHTSIRPQIPNQTCVRPQNPNQTFVQSQNPNQTFIRPQNPNQPFVQSQNPNQTFLRPQNHNQTFIGAQSPNRTCIRPQIPNQTFLRPQNPNQTFLRPQNHNQTFIRPHESYRPQANQTFIESALQSSADESRDRSDCSCLPDDSYFNFNPLLSSTQKSFDQYSMYDSSDESSYFFMGPPLSRSQEGKYNRISPMTPSPTKHEVVVNENVLGRSPGNESIQQRSNISRAERKTCIQTPCSPKAETLNKRGIPGFIPKSPARALGNTFSHASDPRKSNQTFISTDDFCSSQPHQTFVSPASKRFVDETMNRSCLPDNSYSNFNPLMSSTQKSSKSFELSSMYDSSDESSYFFMGPPLSRSQEGKYNVISAMTPSPTRHDTSRGRPGCNKTQNASEFGNTFLQPRGAHNPNQTFNGPQNPNETFIRPYESCSSQPNSPTSQCFVDESTDRSDCCCLPDNS